MKLRIIGTVVLFGLALISQAPTASADGCGLQPLKPLTPLGCKDLRLQCQCDKNGKNCAWSWICVK